MISALLWLAALILVFVVAGTAAWAGFRAAPYVPTRERDVERMLRIADVKPNELVYDLGAGDGRFILKAVQQYQARAVGYEISLLPYVAARFRLWQARLGDRAQMKFIDFYRTDLSAANVVVCFLTPGAMKKLGEKMKRELRPGTRVVSYAFAISGWTPVLKDKPDPGTFAVWLYTV
jgi:SAM-dependent methyltransferase